MNNKQFEIILFGPPASGKGTQARLLHDTFDVPHISTGDILRAVKLDSSNPLAEKVAELIDHGRLIPDKMMNQIVKDRITKDDCKQGFILDGYPRTEAQARALDHISGIDYVFLVDVNDDVVMDRILGRKMCKNGHTWHIKYSPTKKESVCDVCGEELYTRKDDNKEDIKERLRVYHDNTNKILNYYQKQGKLIRVNGAQHIEGVFQDMLKYLVDDLRSKIK